jgi:hypothetical protein
MLPTGIFERSYNIAFLGRLEPEFSLFTRYQGAIKDEEDYSPALYSSIE